jgi:hypothetical protein
MSWNVSPKNVEDRVGELQHSELPLLESTSDIDERATAPKT